MKNESIKIAEERTEEIKNHIQWIKDNVEKFDNRTIEIIYEMMIRL